MTHIDGNAMSGVLSELLTVEPTTARSRCANCGDVAALAMALVYPDAAGWVARCRACDEVLATVVHGDGRTWLSLRGMTAIELER